MDDITKIPHCKGNSLRSFFQTVLERKGEHITQEMFRYLSREIREAYQLNSIMPSAWYPLSWMCDSYKALQKATNEGVQIADEIGYYSAMSDFQGVYRVFFRFMKPETLLEKSARMFPKFYSMGKQEILEARQGYARGKWTAPGFDANLWTDTHAACRVALELCGAKEIKIKFISGGRDGDITSVSEARWK